MSERELEILRRKKLLLLKKKFQTKPENKTDVPKVTLKQYLIGRGLEVLNAAKMQYPTQAIQVENLLVKLITEKKITQKISGQEIYGLFRRLGLRVRLQTTIRVVEHGKIKSLEEKIKETS
jgi:DNA-binding TFAR19-related protein (PDSD5 family)